MTADCVEIHAPVVSDFGRRSQRGVDSLRGHLNESIWRELLFLQMVRGHLQKWKEETALYSNPSEIYSNKHYREVLNHGAKLLPLIISDLEHNGGEWFAALEQLTGVDPIPPAIYGDYHRMRQAWLEWARYNGYR